MEKRGWLDAVLGLGPDWRITRVERTTERKELRVELARAGGGRLRCPHCGEACPGYDTRRREWRNLDAWGYSTFLVCDVPRMRCREHGVVTMQVPWAEGSSRYTAEFEAEAIRWLKEASVQAVAQRMRLSWNAADGIMQRAVARGLAAPPGAGGAALVGGRDGLSPAPPVRDRGVESEEGDRAVCGTGARGGSGRVMEEDSGQPGQSPGARTGRNVFPAVDRRAVVATIQR